VESRWTSERLTTYLLLRLNDYKAQENFFDRIVERYMKFCHESRDNLDKQFALLSLGTPSASPAALGPNTAAESTVSKPSTQPTTASIGTPAASQTISAIPQKAAAKDPTVASPELQLIHMAMRKLREAIVSSHRLDAFAQRAYIFLIRASILAKSWESYQAALLYLLGAIHRHTPLSDSALSEFASYHILDLACRLGDLHGAYAARLRYYGPGTTLGGSGGRQQQRGNRWYLDAILTALVRDDWRLFWRTKRKVDGYVRALMEWAEEGIRLHALKCLGRTYFTVSKGFVEASASRDWEDLKRAGVGWELEEDGEVVIRRVKAK
jgi:hypothetical protein